MKKDIHGFLNNILGIVLALSAGIYASQIPAILFWLLIVASAFLLMREFWVLGGRVKWTLQPIIRKQ